MLNTSTERGRLPVRAKAKPQASGRRQPCMLSGAEVKAIWDEYWHLKKIAQKHPELDSAKAWEDRGRILDGVIDARTVDPLGIAIQLRCLLLNDGISHVKAARRMIRDLEATTAVHADDDRVTKLYDVDQVVALIRESTDILSPASAEKLAERMLALGKRRTE